MDKTDKKILDIIQSRFPIEKRPFQILAKELGLTEEDIISKVAALKDEGIIRRLGAVFDSKKLGYVSTLLAIKVPLEKLEKVAKIINACNGVTHNYLRDYEYNLWFTLTAPSEKKLKALINEIKKKTGVKEILNLPAIRLFKIKAEFDVGEGRVVSWQSVAQKLETKAQTHKFSEHEINLIRQTQEDTPLNSQPFRTIADKIGFSEDEVIEKIKEWLKAGIIRRFGAILRHKKAGFKENAMVVWKVPAERVKGAGEIMATFREVSHCYERPTYSDWPYNLFAMIHGRTKEECEAVIKNISKTVNIQEFKCLYSAREFKKESMKYFC